MSDVIRHPLRAVREARGWSLADLARVVQRRCGLRSQRQKVYRWEHGVTPEPIVQQALAVELGVPADVVDTLGWPAWLTTVTPSEAVDGIWTPAAARDVLTRAIESGTMDRRAFLILSGSSAAGMAIAWSTAPTWTAAADGGRVTPATVASLRARVSQLWHLDDLLGGGGCLDAGVADLRLTSTLLRSGSYDTAVGRELYGLAATLSRFCGWCAFDDGRHAAAQRFLHAALRCSAAAGDTGQGVYALSNLALQAAYAGDGRTTVGLLDVARGKTDPAQRAVLAMLDCWSARGHAIAGDSAAALSAIERADALWETRVEGDDPEWIYWLNRPSLTAEAATAVADAGRHDIAEATLRAGLDSRVPLGERDRALYLTRLADVQARRGDLDAAVMTARDAVEAEAGTSSARIRGLVDATLSAMPAREPAVVELHGYRRELAGAAA